MPFADVSLTALRVFREVAERGTFTAAASALGYTQSAVSRQIAALERAAGTELVRRGHDGVRLTPAGRVVLRRAVTVVDQVDATARELAGLPDDHATVRLGWFPSAGAGLVPRALKALSASHPSITVISREGSTPALVRGLRAGSLDLAVLASAPPFRPLDAETPALSVRVLAERALRVAVPADHPLARGDYIDIADLHGHPWIAGPDTGDGAAMGAWLGLAERPRIAHTARDWLAKLALVAAGCGLTTVPTVLTALVPDTVRVLPVRGGPQEHRRLLLARLPRPMDDPTARVADALRVVALEH
ncbi:LysR family transcriptional regulator [Actinokineospora inagensis]|uniref:LysR family transcriptional regulator n=1 Tax=Actinokineospora inagensis TaxID=103730 RepID=UPI0003F59D2B|nr:LysR family transcriptional regulator [Actinokineospora inagensis]